ncbi:hypothetical protein [Roseovarius ramblicola]|uniref:EF-hand domain-containing protein n=1 Tax=Roseovarius ramblicola TaxID=2022336 RepID=A0ABV5I3L2_9RHOB
MRTTGIFATTVLALAAVPALAAGPVNDKGVLAPPRDAWADARAGQNPLTTDEAAAAMAFFLRCRDVDNLGELDAEAFIEDVMAGGNPANGFTEGGAHWDDVQAWYGDFQSYADMAVTVMCYINPYRKQ